MGHDLNLNKKGKLGKKNEIFCCFVHMRVTEERKVRAKGLFPRSTEFRRSKFDGPEIKVHRINEGYAWVLKMRDFSKDPNEEFVKSKVLGLGSVYEAS